MRAILKQAWQIYRGNFLVILTVVVAVWTPLELLSSYMDAFVFGEDDLRRSWRLAQLLDNFFGIIATAGVIFTGYEALTGQRATFRSALAEGFRSWGRMWWTRCLTGLALLAGFLLLIVPGIYLLARFSVVEPVAVVERISGTAAMRRSFALTEGRFWLVFRLGVVLLGVLMIPLLLTMVTAFVPALDYWLIDAATQLICDVVGAFGTVAIVTAYSHFKNEQTTP